MRYKWLFYDDNERKKLLKGVWRVMKDNENIKAKEDDEMTDIYIIIEDLKFKILPRNTNTAKK